VDIEGFISATEDVLATIDIAEDGISAAQKRYGELPPERDESGRIIGETGPLWSAFRLLRPTHHLMDHTEFVYRAHCRELLDRVALGEDTRPPTGAELVIAMMETSLLAPMTGAANGLYFRLFNRYFPEHARKVFNDWTHSIEDYERMYGVLMDEHEAFARKKLRQEWRC
jgi:hypothetical protein